MISPAKKKKTKNSMATYASMVGGSEGSSIVRAKAYERLEYEDESVTKESVTIHTSAAGDATLVSEEHVVKLTGTFTTPERTMEDKDDGVEASKSSDNPKKA